MDAIFVFGIVALLAVTYTITVAVARLGRIE
jgi:hypothetical protein